MKITLISMSLAVLLAAPASAAPQDYTGIQENQLPHQLPAGLRSLISRILEKGSLVEVIDPLQGRPKLFDGRAIMVRALNNVIDWKEPLPLSEEDKKLGIEEKFRLHRLTTTGDSVALEVQTYQEPALGKPNGIVTEIFYSFSAKPQVFTIYMGGNSAGGRKGFACTKINSQTSFDCRSEYRGWMTLGDAAAIGDPVLESVVRELGIR